MANVTFLGACGTVTGSMTLLEWGERRVLVDCGLFQGGVELEPALRQPVEVDVDVAARVDDGDAADRLAADGIGILRQTPVFEALEDHEGLAWRGSG